MQIDITEAQARALAVLLHDHVEAEANPYDPEEDGVWPWALTGLGLALADATGGPLTADEQGYGLSAQSPADHPHRVLLRELESFAAATRARVDG